MMKNIHNFNTDTRELQEILIKNIKTILKNNQDIDINEIQDVAVYKNGRITFEVPKSIKSRQVIILIAYLMWFGGLTPEDIR